MDKAVVHVEDLMISTSLQVSQMDTEADNQQKTLLDFSEECGYITLLCYIMRYGWQQKQKRKM